MKDDEISTTAELAENDAIPRCHEVHADEDRCQGGHDVTGGRELEPIDEKSPAQWAYERLILYIQNFEKTLDNSQEVAMGFTGAEAGVMRIEGMGFFEPDIITFYGSDLEGVKTQLIQHVAQLNVMLRALPTQTTEAKPARIGFRLAQDLGKA